MALVQIVFCQLLHIKICLLVSIYAFVFVFIKCICIVHVLLFVCNQIVGVIFQSREGCNEIASTFLLSTRPLRNQHSE